MTDFLMPETQQPITKIIYFQGFFSAFSPRGGVVCGKTRRCELLRGQVRMEILTLDLLSDTIWWSLGLFLHKHNLHLSGGLHFVTI